MNAWLASQDCLSAAGASTRGVAQYPLTTVGTGSNRCAISILCRSISISLCAKVWRIDVRRIVGEKALGCRGGFGWGLGEEKKGAVEVG